MEKSIKLTNEEMQLICDQSESHQPINQNGELQASVDDNTMCLVDSNHKMKGKKMIVVIERNGNKGHFVEVVRWW